MTDEEKRMKAAIDNTMTGQFGMLNAAFSSLWTNIKAAINDAISFNRIASRLADNTKKARSGIERFLAPSYGTCKRCNRPWLFVKWHTTYYMRGAGCFPLCEDCWRQLETPEKRMPFYRQMWDGWVGYSSGKACWEQIEAAVLKEIGGKK